MEGMEEEDAIPPWLASVRSKAGDVLGQRPVPVGGTRRIPKEMRRVSCLGMGKMSFL